MRCKATMHIHSCKYSIKLHNNTLSLQESPTFLFFANLALSDVIKVAIAQPLTVINLIMQNWILGSFLCYFLPMLHAFPIHATMMTHVVIAIDRYRFIVHPMKSRIPAGLCIIAVWVRRMQTVLPDNYTLISCYILYRRA